MSPDQIDIALLTYIGEKPLVSEINNRDRPTQSLDACAKIENKLSFSQRILYRKILYFLVNYTESSQLETWLKDTFGDDLYGDGNLLRRLSYENLVMARPAVRAEALVKTLRFLLLIPCPTSPTIPPPTP